MPKMSKKAIAEMRGIRQLAAAAASAASVPDTAVATASAGSVLDSAAATASVLDSGTEVLMSPLQQAALHQGKKNAARKKKNPSVQDTAAATASAVAVPDSAVATASVLDSGTEVLMAPLLQAALHQGKKKAAKKKKKKPVAKKKVKAKSTLVDPVEEEVIAKSTLVDHVEVAGATSSSNVSVDVFPPKPDVVLSPILAIAGLRSTIEEAEFIAVPGPWTNILGVVEEVPPISPLRLFQEPSPLEPPSENIGPLDSNLDTISKEILVTESKRSADRDKTSVAGSDDRNEVVDVGNNPIVEIAEGEGAINDATTTDEVNEAEAIDGGDASNPNEAVGNETDNQAEINTPLPPWMDPKDIPDVFVVPKELEPPKEGDSELYQRMFEVSKRFKEGFPTAHPLMNAFIEFLARSSTDDTLMAYLFEANDMVRGPFFCALPLGWFKDIMKSTDLNLKLGSKRFTKKRNLTQTTKKKNLTQTSGINILDVLLPPNANFRFWVVHHNGRKVEAMNADSLTQNKKLMSQYHKLQNQLVTFFQRQFDSMQADEMANIRAGCQGKMDTLYVIGFDNNDQFHIVGAVQYLSVVEGVYINWFAVEHRLSPNAVFEKKSAPGGKLTTVRKLGLGEFMLSLVQMQQLARGWGATLVLQTNPHTAACEFYKRRGFRMASTNSLKSLPDVVATAFTGSPIHFVTDELQDLESTPSTDRLQLFYLNEFLYDSPLEELSSVFPATTEDDCLLAFPFNCVGNHMEQFVHHQDKSLFSAPLFASIGTSVPSMYALRNMTDARPLPTAFVREEDMYAFVYDAAFITIDAHISERLSRGHVDFWACWMLRNPNSPVAIDVAIVPTMIVDSLERCIGLTGVGFKNMFVDTEERTAQDTTAEVLELLINIDTYLWGHPELFEKRLIFYSANNDPQGYLGFCAINPWVRLVEYAKEKGKRCSTKTEKEKGSAGPATNFLSGLIYNHAGGGDLAGSGEVDITNATSVLMFLNLASRYRDLRLDSKHRLFNYEEMVKRGTPVVHLLILALDGPFGSILSINEDFTSTIPYGFIQRDQREMFYSNMDNNGAEAWCMFMYDTMLSTNSKSLCVVETPDPLTLGKHGHTRAYLQANPLTELMQSSESAFLTCVYMLLREEMVLTVERLRYFYLYNLNKGQAVMCPSRWGMVSEMHKSLMESTTYKQEIGPMLAFTYNEKYKVHHLYKSELNQRLHINDVANYEALSPATNILESAEIAKICLDNNWFHDEADLEDSQPLLSLLESESKKNERWITQLYDDPHPPQGFGPLSKRPNTASPPVPPPPPPPTDPPPTDPVDPPPVVGPTPPPKKSPKRRSSRICRDISHYTPPPVRHSPTKHKKSQHQRRKERLEEPWGYLPISIARALEANVIASDEETTTESDMRMKKKRGLIDLADDSKFPIPRKLSKFETNREEAVTQVGKLLNVPNLSDRNKIDGIRKNIVDGYERVAFQTWINTAENLVALEADILLYENVTAIAWIPEGYKSVVYKKGTKLRGHYKIRVMRDSGEEDDVEAEIDWVQANFPADVLATVQAAAYQKIMRVKVDTHEDSEDETLAVISLEDKDRTGFFDLEGTGENFVDVKDEGVGVKLDNDIINRFKYVKEKEKLIGPIFKKNDDGKIMKDEKGASIRLEREKMIIPAQWYGYSNKSQRVVKLTEKWVTQNLDKRLISQIKNLSKQKAAFVSIPPGDDRQHIEAAYRTMATGPFIKYQQGKNQRTCMVYAMASAVHYSASRQLASEIRNMAVKFEFKIGAFSGFIQSLGRKHKGLNSKRENAATFDLLNRNQNNLVLACIRGNDGKEDHCIAVYRAWIFDSNFPRALRLNKDSLDLCCSSENEKTTFTGCSQVASFPYLYMAK
jgi:hypothetical protein